MVDNSKVSSYHKNYNNNNTWKEESYHNNNRKCSHQQYTTTSTCNSTNNRTINNNNNRTKVPDTTTRLNIVTTATSTATSINHTKRYRYNRKTCPKANWLVVVLLLVLVVVVAISFSSLVDNIVIDIVVVESFQLQQQQQQQQQRQHQVTKSLLSTISSQSLTTSSLLFLLSTVGRCSSSYNSNSRNCNRLSRTCTSITPFGIIGTSTSTSTSSIIGQRQRQRQGQQLHQPNQRERLLTLFLASSVPVFDNSNDNNVNVKMTTTTTTLDSKEQSGEEITNNNLNDNVTSSNNNNDAIGTTKSNKRQLEEEQGDSSSTDSTTTTSNTKKTKENSDPCTVILVSDTSQLAPNVNDNDNVSTNNHNNTDTSIDRYEKIKARMVQRINGMNQRAKQEVPLTDDEINDIISSIQALSLSATTTSTDTSTCIDYDELRALLVEVGHVSHKNWTRTGTYGRKLGSILRFNNTSTSSGNDPVVSTSSLTASASFSSTTSSSNNNNNNNNNNTYSRTMLRRILTDGNWDGAVQHTIYNNDQVMADGTNYFLHPWVVLVTGVNGIRKTTSIYQSWFPKLLQQALVGPDGTNVGYTIDESCLPVGTNSFFRQLDHIIATVCNKDFNILYQYAYDLLVASSSSSSSLQRQEQTATTTTTTVTNDKDVAAATQAAADVLEQILQTNPPSDVIKLYSDLKASIFTRYRTISELLGAYLLYEAQKVSINCMLETSGRDVAMFHYVDHFFPSHTYKKLVLHFTINDLSYAQESVDTRMINEIHSGIRAITSPTTTSTATTTTNSKNNKQQQVYDVQRIIQTNLGGPYGSDVLPSVQRDSDTVWESIIQRSETVDTVGQDWYKASIQINARPIGGEPWTAQAILPDGTLGTKYTFT